MTDGAAHKIKVDISEVEVEGIARKHVFQNADWPENYTEEDRQRLCCAVRKEMSGERGLWVASVVLQVRTQTQWGVPLLRCLQGLCTMSMHRLLLHCCLAIESDITPRASTDRRRQSGLNAAVGIRSELPSSFRCDSWSRRPRTTKATEQRCKAAEQSSSKPETVVCQSWPSVRLGAAGAASMRHTWLDRQGCCQSLSHRVAVAMLLTRRDETKLSAILFSPRLPGKLVRSVCTAHGLISRAVAAVQKARLRSKSATVHASRAQIRAR